MAYDAFSNFTPRARRALALARKEADRFNHNFLHTDHLLLGLVGLGEGIAVAVFGKMGIKPETIRAKIELCMGAAPEEQKTGKTPYTPSVKEVLALAAEEARCMDHFWVGTGHILLGILREGGNGAAARVLKNFKMDIEKTRLEILKLPAPTEPSEEKGNPV